MNTHRVRALGAACVLALTAGCGNDGSPTTAPTADAPAATATSTNPLPRDRVLDGGTFTYAISGMPSNFNTNELDGGERDTTEIMEALMPSTHGNDADGTPIWNRDFLASEPTLTATDPQIVEFEIHPEAAWYDGTPITWEDFHWQWRASSGVDPAYRIVSSNGFENIGSVERGGHDRHVIVTFETPYADWQSIFFRLYPASTNKDPETFNAGWAEQPLTTAGPFKFESLDRTTQTITLVRNEKWWGAPAKLDRMVFRAIDVSAHIDALANGEVDAIDIGPDASQYRRALGITGVEIRRAGGPNFRHLTINGTSPGLTDVRVRRALAMAIDRESIARALLGPLDAVPTPLNNHIFMANQEGYRDNSGELGRYDPQRAAALLDEAGWILEGDVRRNGDLALEIACVIPSGVQVSRQESELIQNMLARIGVKVNIDVVPTNDFFEKYVTPGQFGFTVFSWIGTPYPLSSAQSIYANPTVGPDGQLAIQQNYARVGSAEIDALYAQANAEFDRTKAIEIANRIDALIWDEVHSLTLYQRPELIAVKRGLANYGAYGLQTPWSYADMGWTAEP
jgi:peptide/nickel transport system substrate-binding protein